MLSSRKIFSIPLTDINANKFQIAGSNPLQSKLFDILNTEENKKSISIETASMKLKCTLFEPHLQDINPIFYKSGSIEILFDRFGNYRFWFPTVNTIKNYSFTLKMIPLVLRYFHEIDGFEDENLEELSDKEDLDYA